MVMLLTVLEVPGQSTYEPYSFTTFVGTIAYGSADGTGSAARFYHPAGLAVDAAGNVYVADNLNSTIRKVTPGGVVTTLAGLVGSSSSIDGTGSAARFVNPGGVAMDGEGNLYVTDAGATLRKVTPAGEVTTLAGLAGSYGSVDGPGRAARFRGLSGVALDVAGNIYLSDSGNNTIRKVTAAGVVTTLAGLAGELGGDDGTGSTARFWNPWGVAVDRAGNVYVGDLGNNAIRKVTPEGVVTTLAGLVDFGRGRGGSADGTGSEARFYDPSGVAVDSQGNVFVADNLNDTIRKVTPAGVVSTLVGLPGTYGSTGGLGSNARFDWPRDVAVDSGGNVYVTEMNNNTIRKVTPAGSVTTLAGVSSYGNTDGTAADARFWDPYGVAIDKAGNLYVADIHNNAIRKVTPAGLVTTLAGLPGNSGSADGTGSSARFNQPLGVAVDSAGTIFVADALNSAIRKVTPLGVVTTLAGSAGSIGSVDGTTDLARFNHPSGVAVDDSGNVFVADTLNYTIRKITPAGLVTTLAGLAGSFGPTDGTGSAARFGGFYGGPFGLAIDAAGNLFVTDAGTIIRKVTPAGAVTTVVGRVDNFGSADGTGTGASLFYPTGIAVDGAGNLYVADNRALIRKVTPAGIVTTLAGVPSASSFPVNVDGTGRDVRFSFGLYNGGGVAVDADGNVYVADTANSTIRKGYPVPRILVSDPSPNFFEGHFSFSLTGAGSRPVLVEASTDLATWLPIWTNSSTGPLSFQDPQTGNYPKRFYRARTL